MTGLTLAHYRIDAELGRGGMGVVYRAQDTELDRIVALKVLPAAAVAGAEERARFYREAKAAAGLSHPNIATVYGIGEAVPSDAPHGAEAQPFIAMEFVDGESLSARIARGPVPLADAVRIARDMADALAEAHGAGIVHRDVKSANVMLTSKERVKVLDFGLAKTAASTMLTRLGATLGTAAFMSPEQTQGLDVDGRTDVWALGVVLYEMVAGRLPFAGDYEQAVVYSILNADPEPLTSLRTGVPMELERIVTKCLAKDASRRYAGMVDLRVDLEALLDAGLPGPSRAGQSSVGTATGMRPPLTKTGFGSAVSSADRSPPAVRPRGGWSPAFRIGAAALALLVTAAVSWIAGRSAAPESPVINAAPAFTFSVDVPAPGGYAVKPVPTPDGQVVAYLAARGLYFRHGDGRALEAPRFPGPVEAFSPAPDSRSFAVAVGTEESGFVLYQVPVDADSGTTPMKIAEADEAVGMTYGPDGNLYLGGRKGLYRLEPGQDRAEILVSSDRFDGRLMLYPSEVPGRDALLVVLAPGPALTFTSLDSVRSVLVELPGGRATAWAPDQVAITYLPSGMLLYLEGNYQWTLRRFDLDERRFSGDRVVLDYQFSPLSSGRSSTGIMVSVPETPTLEYGIVESDRAGTADRSWFEEKGGFLYTRLSSDRSRYATVSWVQGTQLYIGRNGLPPVRQTGNPRATGSLVSVAWSADGNRLFATAGGSATGESVLWALETEGGQSFTQLASFPDEVVLLDASRDGRFLLSAIAGPAGQQQRMVLMDTESFALTDLALLSSEIMQSRSPLDRTASFSPDSGSIIFRVRDATNVMTHRIWTIGSTESRLVAEGYDHLSWIDDGSVMLERFANSTAAPPVPARYFRQSISQNAQLQGQPTLIAEVADAVPFDAVFNPATGGVIAPIARSQDTVPLTIHTNWFAELERMLPPGN